jgi:hypothetical protein
MENRRHGGASKYKVGTGEFAIEKRSVMEQLVEAHNVCLIIMGKSF